MKPFISLLIGALVMAPVSAQEIYEPSPIVSFEDRFEQLVDDVEELQRQQCDLDERLLKLEDGEVEPAEEASKSPSEESASPEPTEVVITVVIEDGSPKVSGPLAPVVAPLALPVVKPAAASVQQVVTTKASSASVRRLKTTSEMLAGIAASYAKLPRDRQGRPRTYATISPQTRSWATNHLVQGAPNHRFLYPPSMLSPLSLNDLLRLHNLVHSSYAVNPYTTGASAQPADFFTPTPRDPKPTPKPAPRNYTGGCPNGQCPTSNSRVRRTGLLGRIFGRR